MINDKQYYFDLFGVNGNLLDKLAADALSRGGDFSDLFFESTVSSDLLLRDSQVASGATSEDFGAGIRTVFGEKTGYAYSESTDPAALEAAAKAACAIAPGVKAGEAGDRDSSRPRLTGRPNPAADRYPMALDPRTQDSRPLAQWLAKLEERIRALDTRVVKVIAVISTQVSDLLMYNSYGELKYDTRPMCSVSVSVIFSQKGSTENSSASRSFRCGTEMLTDELCETLAREAVKGIDERFEAKRPRGGVMSVVMGAGASGILLHEAMGHAFEADFNRKGQSVFSGKIGQKICPEGITIVDDATIRGNRGSLNFDDEGVPGQRTVMVEDGVLTSYLHDRVSARFYGVSPTGNGRRESFRYNPIPRMRATYMEDGGFDPREIIESVKKGIYVDKFSNGQVKIGEGDFTFYVKSGMLIENGRLTAPVKDINIIGNGPEALASLVMAGNDSRIDDGTWTCGKEQSVPVSCGIPTVRVEGLTVGGN